MCGLAASFSQMILLDHAIDFRRFFVAQIQHVEHRLAREKHEAGEHLLLFGLEFEFAQRRFRFERLAAAQQHLQFGFEQRVFLLFQILFDAFDALGRLLEIVEDQLDVDALDIAHRIERADLVRHGRVFEQAHHVRQRVRLAQRHERRGILLAVLLQAADIDVLDGRVGDFLRLEYLGQLRHARVRHARDAHVRLIRRACARPRAPS